MSRGSRPRVLFINQFYYPDSGATAQLLTDLAEYMAARGTEVSVLAGRRLYRDSGAALPRREKVNGVEVFRVGSTGFGRRGFRGRLADYLSFYVCAFVRAVFLPRPDVIVALSTPPMIQCLGVLLKRIKGCRLVAWTMDVYPEAAVALGALPRRSAITRVLRALGGLAVRDADAVIALSDAMASRLEANGAHPDAVHTVHNWADGRAILPIAPRANPFRRGLEADGKLIVEYSGNMGLGHSFETVLKSTKRLAGDSGYRFLFIGDGPGLDRIISYKKKHGLANVDHLPCQPRGRLAYTLSAGDVHLITLRHGLEGLLVPSKLYGIMAAGRPVIFLGPEQSEVAQVIREAGCGHVVSDGETDSFIAALASLRNSPAARLQMGRNARRFFERHFQKDNACARIRRIISGLVSDGDGAQTTAPASGVNSLQGAGLRIQVRQCKPRSLHRLCPRKPTPRCRERFPTPGAGAATRAYRWFSRR